MSPEELSILAAGLAFVTIGLSVIGLLILDGIAKSETTWCKSCKLNIETINQRFKDTDEK